MSHWNVGDRVQVVTRLVTEEDKKANRYFEHMAGLVGTIENVYTNGEVAVNVDLSALGDISGKVHSTATERMRAKFNDNVTEEQRKALTKEELEFTPHYVLLLKEHDVVKA